MNPKLLFTTLLAVIFLNVHAQFDWTIQTSAADNGWTAVAYGNGLFVAVAASGTGDRVMTSPDGITWTIRTSAADNGWRAITHGNGLFVAVASSGTGDRVMTSPDGITWTIRTSAADNQWVAVTYSNGLFVAVALTGTGNRVMTSPDGITWTIRTSAADNNWSGVTYGNGLFVAAASSGTGNRVMTSPDGITWTIRTSAADNSWGDITYGNGLFVAVAFSGTGDRVMTSPDGVNWTLRTSAADNGWVGVTYGNGRFVATSADGTGDRVMTSSMPTWTGATNNSWNNTGNWREAIVPISTDNVVIPDVTNNPSVNTAAVATNLTLDANATIIIQPGFSLTVSGLLTNNGEITVAVNGASLVQETGSTLAGSGNYAVGADRTEDVTFICSPISNQTVGGFGGTPSGANGAQLIPNATLPCNADSIDPASPYGYILEMRENPTVLNSCAQSLWHVKSSGTLENGRGYSVTNPVQGGGFAFIFYGNAVNNGNVSYTGLTRQAGTITDSDGSTPTRGWHLVGNPYPSPITITPGDLTGFDAQLHRYNDATGSFVSNNPLVSVTVAIGQGFQIRKTSVGGTVDFDVTNAMRTTGNPTAYKQETIPQEFYLNITLDNGTNTDNTMVYFYDGATDGFDPMYDANRLNDAIHLPMVYTIASAERLSYNALPLMNVGESKSVPLAVRTEVHGSHTLTFNDVNTLEATVVLEDLKLNTLQTVTEGYAYNFTTVAGDARERFVLHFAAEVASGISNISNNGVKLFPNPTTGSTTLVLTENHGYTHAMLTDLSGKTIQSYPLTQNTNQALNTDELPGGIYFIRLKGEQDQTTVKLIRQ